MTANPIGYRLEGTVATLRFDDGKANAISHLAIDELAALPRRAFSETKRRVRGSSAEVIRRSLAEEMGS